jgi:prepilin-type N-terminal cleavage/methylation domain-containing protein
MVMQQQRGFTLVEVVVVIAIAGILAAVGIGMTTTSVRMYRGESGATRLEGSLKRHRGGALARRRDIEIQFLPPNQVRSVQRPGLGDADPDPRVLETLTLEGGIEFRTFDEIPDTPNAFGNGAAVTLGGLEPVMFASEGMFMDVAANPVNATILLGIENDPLSASAVTVLGTTATIERWRWNGTSWTK